MAVSSLSPMDIKDRDGEDRDGAEVSSQNDHRSNTEYPTEAVNREAGLGNQRVRYQQMAVQQFERWRQLDEGDLRRELTGKRVGTEDKEEILKGAQQKAAP